ncbi:MAG: fimbrillin family protein [Muribaculaceae bacterium]|nr:fimbrillin family protein [Muribaculaceae bacterium]
MKISKYAALIVILPALASCVQESPEVAGPMGSGSRIFFRSYLPGVTLTRGGTISDLTECRVTCINPADTTLIDSETGEITTYFSDIRFVKDEESDGRFITEESDTCMWPYTKDQLHFFAYHPSADAMRETIDSEKYNLANYSKTTNGITTIDYRLESFSIAPDIADHVDFIAAYSNGNQQANENTGVGLNFNHQLARIELMAWSESLRYDIEIAGVRIGNPISQGDFNFSTIVSGQGGEWLNTSQTPVEHIFTTGESIVYLGKTSHVDQQHATSIMGNAGPAMVIPMTEKIEAWGGSEDPGLGTEKYSTDKLYFSVLLRAKNWADVVAYPYPDDPYNLPKVYLAVRNDGMVVRRVYMIDGDYYTADEKSDELKYTPSETEEVRAYCWAALPVAAKWEPGKIYSYKLNYTNGIGWHDPSYPAPGTPIIDDRVSVNVEVSDWKEGTATDVSVPRK